MARPSEKLATSLSALQELQKDGRRVFQSKEMSRVYRDRLLKHGFLQIVMKGWLISASPGAQAGDSTPWFASFWEFCAQYSNERFGEQWHLSPEQSLLLHAENTIIPSQAIIYSPNGHNNTVALLYRTSLYDLREPQLPARIDLVIRNGLRLFSPAAALIRVPESFFIRNPIETQVVLAGIRDVSELLRPLLDGGHSAIAGRLAGALRRVGRAEQADEIRSTMRAAGYDVRESDPFEVTQRVFEIGATTEAPIVGRLQAMWAASRDVVLKCFPKSPGLPKDKRAYLSSVDEIYQSDAYHSLSIEGSCDDWQRRICKGSRQIIAIRQEALASEPKIRAFFRPPPARRPKFTQNSLCKPQAAEVGLAFEAVEGFMDDDLNGCHFIVGQLLKFTFASLAA